MLAGNTRDFSYGMKGSHFFVKHLIFGENLLTPVGQFGTMKSSEKFSKKGGITYMYHVEKSTSNRSIRCLNSAKQPLK